MNVATVAGTLPGSGRAFRLAVADGALGVHVDSAIGGDPFVAVVNNRVRNLADLAELDAVARYVLAGEAP